MNKTSITTKKNYIKWIKFAIASITFLFINLLTFYFFSWNIYSDLVFVFVVFFTFKLLRLNSLNVFLYSIFYFFVISVFVLFKDFILSYKITYLLSFYIKSASFYAMSFFILAFLAYIYEEKLEEKINFRRKRISYLCMLFIFCICFILLFFNLNPGKTVTKMAINNIKGLINRTFNKEEYYSKKGFIVIDGEKVYEDILISGNNLKKEDMHISGKIILTGWAIEKNSIYDTGIDRMEFFLNGKPGEGKYLGKFSLNNYRPKLETSNFIDNLYINLYERLPSESELSFWSINLEYNLMSYYEVADNIIKKSGFMERTLTDEEFLNRLYACLLNRGWDGTWIRELKTDLSRKDVLYILINSEEFKKYSENYYKNITLKNHNLDVIRKDIGKKYGKQFYLSGFSLKFDSTVFPAGEHTLYIYAHSPVFGWDYQAINLIIDNH